MCFINVKDEQERSEAIRVREVRRVSAPVAYARRSIIEERRPEPSISEREESRTVIRSERESRGGEESRTVVRSERGSVRGTSRAPSVRGARSAYVHVDYEDESSVSSESETIAASEHTRKSSKSRADRRSEYSMHEREVRRERDYGVNDGYETFRYVDAPRNVSRGGYRDSVYGGRASRDSFGGRISSDAGYARRSGDHYRRY